MEILDSGARVEFDTGAVRDIREGKGRCDLMPMYEVATCLTSPTLINISNFIKQPTSNVPLYIAIDGFSKECDNSLPQLMLDVAKHFEDGAKKYGENNWQKGIPVHCYIDSAIRHYLKWKAGYKDEPHDRAFVWNILCCIWTVTNKPELNDILKKE